MDITRYWNVDTCSWILFPSVEFFRWDNTRQIVLAWLCVSYTISWYRNKASGRDTTA